MPPARGWGAPPLLLQVPPLVRREGGRCGRSPLCVCVCVCVVCVTVCVCVRESKEWWAPRPKHSTAQHSTRACLLTNGLLCDVALQACSAPAHPFHTQTQQGHRHMLHHSLTHSHIHTHTHVSHALTHPRARSAQRPRAALHPPRPRSAGGAAGCCGSATLSSWKSPGRSVSACSVCMCVVCAQPMHACMCDCVLWSSRAAVQLEKSWAICGCTRSVTKCRVFYEYFVCWEGPRLSPRGWDPGARVEPYEYWSIANVGDCAMFCLTLQCTGDGFKLEVPREGAAAHAHPHHTSDPLPHTYHTLSADFAQLLLCWRACTHTCTRARTHTHTVTHTQSHTHTHTPCPLCTLAPAPLACPAAAQ